MDDVRFGLVIRAVRRRRRWRQSDLAAASGVSQQTISRIENGGLEEMSLGAVRRVAAALRIGVRLDARWRGPQLDSLLDERHSRLVDLVVRRLRELGWTCLVEHTFAVGRDAGSVDVLGWREGARTLLTIEVKTSLPDLQDMLSTLDRKARLIRATVEERYRWSPTVEALVLVLPDSPAIRGIVERRAGIFDAAFPARTVAVRRWLASPAGPIRGIWFLSDTRRGSGIEKAVGPRRVRVPSPARSAQRPRSSGS